MELPPSDTPRRRLAAAPLAIIAVLLVMAFVYWASPVLVPLALSVLLAFLLNPLVTFLQRRRVPRTAGSFVVTTAALIVIGLLGWLFASQLIHLGSRLPEYERRITERIDSIRESGRSSLLSKVQRFAESVTRAATLDKSRVTTEAPKRVILVGQTGASLSPLFSALGPILDPLATIGLVVVLSIYLLIDGENLRDRFLRLVGQGNMPLTTRAIDEAGSRISRYLIAQFFLNAAFGVIVAVGLAMLGLPHAPLWGFMAAFFRYVPYLGPWLAVVFPLALSLMTSDGWFQPIGVLVVFAIFELISNIIVEPLVYGRSIGLSQSSLIVAIAFWAWVWGPMRLVLAAPMTVCLAIMGKYVPGLKVLDILLGSADPLSPAARFYQRLLAHDEDGAFQCAVGEQRDESLSQLFDRILLPALGSARSDLAANRLEKEEAESIWMLTADIGEEIAMVRARELNMESAPINELELSEVHILACAVRDGAEEAALRLYETCDSAQNVNLVLANANRLASEIASMALESNPAAVLLISLPPGGLSRTRLVCKRLRQAMTEIKIVVGRWGIDDEAEENRKLLIDAGADSVVTTIEETAVELGRFTRLARLAGTPGTGRQELAAH